MADVTLIRYEQNQYCTFGIMFGDGFSVHTLELPWRGNNRNVSCIPIGEYKCGYMERSSSGKYRNVYHVRGVAGRSGILVHAGNLPDQTMGCVLVGKRRGFLAGAPAVLNSKSALMEFVRAMDRDNFKLRVLSWIG